MLRQYLLQEFERRSASNPSYSLRAFARDLDINSGTLSSILNKRRTVGARLLSHLLDKLPLTVSEKKRILSDAVALSTSPNEPPTLLDEQTLSVIKDWEHYAIMAYLLLRKAKKSPDDMAKALGLPLEKVNQAILNLEKTELVKRDAGALVLTHNSLVTTTGIPSASLREAHVQYLDKAKEALTDFNVTERDITGRTMAISKKNLPKAKELIQQFRKELAELLEQGEVDDVYRLNVQLFPLTHKSSNESV